MVESALGNPTEQATIKKLSVFLRQGDVDGALILLGLKAKGK